MRGVAEMRRHRRARSHRRGDLLRGSAGVPDAHNNPPSYEGFDEPRRFGPFGRQRDQANQAVSRFLKSVEFLEIGRPHPVVWMRAPRAVLRRDVGPLQMDAFDGLPFGNPFARFRQVAQSGRHVVRRPGDHRSQKTRDTAGMQLAQRTADVLMRGEGRVEVDARVAVHLKIDPTRRKERRIVEPAQHRLDRIDRCFERNLDQLTRGNLDAATFHRGAALFTIFSQGGRHISHKTEIHIPVEKIAENSNLGWLLRGAAATKDA